ncbi:MAG: hypothetical protein ABSE73_00985 [Planctomycetota bacterium]
MTISPLANRVAGLGLFAGTGIALRNLPQDTYQDLYHQVRSSFNALKAHLGVQPAALLKETVESRFMAAYKAQITYAGSTSSKSTGSTTRQGASNNYTLDYNLRAESEAKSTLDSVSATKTASNVNGAKQTTLVGQEKQVATDTKDFLDRNAKTAVTVDVAKKGGATVKETNIATQATQTETRKGETEALTNTQKLTITEKKGQPDTVATADQTVAEQTNSDWKQNTLSAGTQKIVEETSTGSINVRGLQAKETNYNATDTTKANTTVDTQAHTDYAAQITNLNTKGDVTSQRAVHTTADTTQAQNIATNDVKTDKITTIQAAAGKQSVTGAVEKRTDTLNQTAQATTTTLNTALNPDGTPIRTQQTVVNSQTNVTGQSTLEVARLVAKGPQGVEGVGGTLGHSESDTTTNVQTTAPNGAVTDQQVERNITTDTNSAWQGAIKEQDNGANKSFKVSDLNIAGQQTQDVTTAGGKQVQVNTQAASAKEISGNVDYTAQTGAANTASAPKATVAVNFGTYTGLASGFTFDSGTVNFSLSFQSAQETGQQTVKTAQNGATAQVTGQAGQLTDATITGTMTSTVNDQGQRVIQVQASYSSEGDKFAVDNNGVRQDAAVGAQNTEVDFSGQVVISQNGNTKNITSQVEVDKVQQSDAAGTGMAAVKTAVAQNDPLSAAFTYDPRGFFAFNLGFATMNMSVRA